MTNGLPGHRRRSALSISSPVPGGDPVGRLDQVVEILHQINRALPQSALCRAELIALGGLLTQVGGALLTWRLRRRPGNGCACSPFGLVGFAP